jgi:putative ABC transport system permease protein
LIQFFVEAVALCLVGGTIGVALGFGSALAISYLAQWRTVVAPATIALAFGFYPARKAVRLNPIEALRYE